jgi:PAS domain S-box-containing protein
MLIWKVEPSSTKQNFACFQNQAEWQWILARGKVFEWDESGKPLRMTGTHKNINERKALERELALREARLNAFFASSPIGLKILDDQLRFVQINEPLAQINGLSARDHIGKTVREVLPDLAPTLEPLYQQVMTTGEPILNLELSGETPSLPGIVRYWMTSYFPIPGEEGRPSGVGSVVVEISEVYDELRLRNA